MAYLGKLVSQTGKQHRIFTSAKEAEGYVDTHDKGRYGYKPITVYGVYLKKRKKGR